VKGNRSRAASGPDSAAALRIRQGAESVVVVSWPSLAGGGLTGLSFRSAAPADVVVRKGPLGRGSDAQPRQSVPVIFSVKLPVVGLSLPASVTCPVMPRSSPVPMMLVEVA
jgi:hypothetical protein